MSYLSFRNWGEYQHYKDRHPPWIKFYVRVLDDVELRQLPLATQLLFDRLLLVAARNSNAILKNPETIANLTGIPPRACREGIEQLIKGRWLRETQTKRRASTTASKPASKPARPEAEAEKETEPLTTNGSIGTPATADDDIPFEHARDRGGALDHHIAKLLPLLPDRDDRTELVLRSFAGLPDASWAKVTESVQTQRPRYPTRYAVGALKLERQERGAA